MLTWSQREIRWAVRKVAVWCQQHRWLPAAGDSTTEGGEEAWWCQANSAKQLI
jgi:hypothetical protein